MNKIKTLLLKYGASEQEADNFISDLEKMPDEVEDTVKEAVEKDFNDPKESDSYKAEEKEFN